MQKVDSTEKFCTVLQAKMVKVWGRFLIRDVLTIGTTTGDSVSSEQKKNIQRKDNPGFMVCVVHLCQKRNKRDNLLTFYSVMANGNLYSVI